MNEKKRIVIENQIRTIQAQLELLLMMLTDEGIDPNAQPDEPKKKKHKTPFQGEKGVCDKFCDENDVLNLSTFGGKNKFECKRCGLSVESTN